MRKKHPFISEKVSTSRSCAWCKRPIFAIQQYRADGRKKGVWAPIKYCSLRCTGAAASARQAAKARGRFLDKHGYVLLTNRKQDNGYQQPEHRFVMEQILGRKLLKHETVHHKNGIRHDNRPENLELWGGRHGRGQRVADQDIWSGMIPSWVREDHSPY
jgi:hypothetical protein